MALKVYENGTLKNVKKIYCAPNGVPKAMKEIKYIVNNQLKTVFKEQGVIKEPFTLENIGQEDVNLQLSKSSSSIYRYPTIHYKINDGEWTNWKYNDGAPRYDKYINVKVGDKVSFKTLSTRTIYDTGLNKGIWQFYQPTNNTALFRASGNIMSWIDYHWDQPDHQTYLPDYAFNGMFSGSSTPLKLRNTPILPEYIDTFGYRSLYLMFNSNTHIEDASNMTLNLQHYSPTEYTGTGFTVADNMFTKCSGLISPPKIIESKYDEKLSLNYAFEYCSNLEKLPFDRIKLTGTYPNQTHSELFRLCSKIKMSSTLTGIYTTPFYITGVSEGSNYIFRETGGTYKPDTTNSPLTIYTANEIVK